MVVNLNLCSLCFFCGCAFGRIEVGGIHLNVGEVRNYNLYVWLEGAKSIKRWKMELERAWAIGCSQWPSSRCEGHLSTFCGPISWNMMNHDICVFGWQHGTWGVMNSREMPKIVVFDCLIDMTKVEGDSDCDDIHCHCSAICRKRSWQFFRIYFAFDRRRTGQNWSFMCFASGHWDTGLDNDGLQEWIWALEVPRRQSEFWVLVLVFFLL